MKARLPSIQPALIAGIPLLPSAITERRTTNDKQPHGVYRWSFGVIPTE
jgi:hypothetical protein